MEDLKLELKYPAVGNFAIIAEILGSQLGNVGIQVELEPRDFPTYLEEVVSAEVPAYQATPLAGSQQIEFWMCPGWFTRDCVEEFDELLTHADASTDRDEWAELRRRAVELHADRAFLIPLFNSSIIFALREDLAGFKPYRSYIEVDLRGLRWEE
jgi:peptide/nickel transport system substrate-binding protein